MPSCNVYQNIMVKMIEIICRIKIYHYICTMNYVSYIFISAASAK